MAFMRILPLVAAAAVALSSCAQQEEPAPIRPEPVYNKLGDIVGGCVPSGRIPQTPYEQSLPSCEQQCPEGQSSVYTANVGYQCVPVDQRCPPGQRAVTGTTFAGYRCVPLDQPDSGRPDQRGQDPTRG
ncbi:MAG: hypothetical protein N2Z62_03430 [Rhodobacteraceae bacterium]|nr:hypothetical protein [Paracoccaceae bacterium]